MKFWNRATVRRRLIAGMIVIAPVTATAVVLWWIFQLLDGLLGRFLYPALGGLVGRETVVIPGLGLLVLFLLLLTIGWAAERAVGSRAVAWWHATLERIPVTRRIYGAANRIVRAVLGEESRAFKKVVLVEWPSAGRYSIGFLSGPAPAVIREHVDTAVAVFVPTTPNPTTGFLVIIPSARTQEIALSVDEAFTYLLSAGSVPPDEAKSSPGLAFASPFDGAERLT